MAACSAGGQGPYTDEHTLIYANLTEGGVDREAVDKFNETHSDVQIEVRDYFDEDGFSGKDRLLTEIAAGKIPDIIDFGKEGRGFRYTKLPYRQLAQKGYLEDLWPYIESDPELGREGVLEAPLKAAEVNGGLYLAFSAVGVNTLVGAESVVGNRSSWTMEELREAFALMPDESTVLTYYYDRDMMFDDIFNMSLDGYVDWESGQCCFDSDAFRSDLEFINSFPSEVSWASEEELNDKINEQMLTGRQMLDWVWFRYPIDIQELDSIYGSIYGSRASFVGFPVADGSVGSSFSIVGRKLAMSSSCKNKEACWEFLRQMFLPRYNNKTIVRAMYSQNPVSIPINRTDYETLIKGNRNLPEHSMSAISFGMEHEFQPVSQKDCQRYDDFVNSISRIELVDHALVDIVKEACGPYFAGDKTLDETVELVQNRVTLYVNENK